MDHYDTLLHLREDVAAADPKSLRQARLRLLDRAGRHPGRWSSPKRPARLVPVVVAAGALAATAVVVPWNGPTQPAAAAELLHRAADRATTDPVPGPGQYLEVETRERALGYTVGGDGVDGAYRTTEVALTYVPHDRDGVWTTRSWAEPPTTTYGGPAALAAARRDYAASAHADDPAVRTAAAGAFGNGELGGDGPTPAVAVDLSDLPRDPRRLRERLAAAPMAATSADERVFDQVGELLRTGLVPSDLRATMFDTLALLPEVVVERDQLSMDGRRGTALGLRSGGELRSVVVDPGTGDFLGVRSVQVHREGPVPAGTVTDLTSVRTRVVDTVSP